MRAPTGISLLALAVAMLMSAQESPLAGTARAADDELNVQPDQQTSLDLTIYQQSIALVEDRRMVTLTEGFNRVAFAGVSAQLHPESVLVSAGGEPLTLVEQRYESNLLTPKALLDDAVGRDIRIAIRNPQTGDEKIEKATLLSAAQGLVLKIGDRIETTPPGRLVYDAVPTDLRDKPALVLGLTSLKGGSQPVELGYLTGGVSWSANYVVELAPSEDKLAIIGRASIANTSGASFRKARLTLVAGTVNQVSDDQPPRPQPMPRMAGMAAAGALAAAPATPAPEALSDYYRFAIDREITLGDRETIQLALMGAPAVPAEKEYWLTGTAPITGGASGEPTAAKIEVKLSFENKKADGLGGPLPRGVVRVYQRGKDGALALLGEDRMVATAADEPVKLNLGQAFDVMAKRRQTSLVRSSDRSYEAGEELRLRNAKDQPVTVTVSETLPGDWRIVEESDVHEQATASSARWSLTVPAHGEHVLTYRVLTRF